MDKQQVVEEITFEPGHVYLRTRADVPAEEVFRAWTTFDPAERLTLWPGITPKLYELHHVGEGEAECTEGTAMFPMKVWAREHYTWDADRLEIRNRIVDSNMFVAGGTGHVVITPMEDGGCIVEETYRRPATGVMAGMMNRMLPRKAPRLFEDKRSKTYAILATRLADREPVLS